MEELLLMENKWREERSKHHDVRDAEYEALLGNGNVADVLLYGFSTRESRIHQVDALIELQRKIPSRADRSHVLLVSANVLSMAIMSSQLSMHRWRVSEAQTLTQATLKIEEQISRAVKCGFHVRRAPTNQPSASAQSKRSVAASTRLASANTVEAATAATPRFPESYDAETSCTEAADVSGQADGRTSPCSSVCSAELDDRHLKKPPATDMVAHLVVVDGFTHEPFVDILEHLRYFDREYGLGLIIVLMLHDSYNGHAPGVVVMPQHNIKPEDAYRMGYDLVLRRVFDHKVVNFFSDTFVSSSGRWRNDVRRRAAVGNYRNVKDVLLGYTKVSELVDDVFQTPELLTFPMKEGNEAVARTNGSAGEVRQQKPPAGIIVPFDKTLNTLFMSRPVNASSTEAASVDPFETLTVACDATGEVMRPAQSVKHAVRRPVQSNSPSDKNNTKTATGGGGATPSDDEDNFEDVLVDETDEIESAVVEAYRREITRLAAELERGKRTEAFLQEEAERLQGALERASSGRRRYGSINGGDISTTLTLSTHFDEAEDLTFGGYSNSADIPVTLTKEQQIFQLKQRLLEATERLAIRDGTHPRKGRKQNKTDAARDSISLSKEFKLTLSSKAPRKMEKSKIRLDARALQRCAEALERDLMAQHDVCCDPFGGSTLVRRHQNTKKRGRKKEHGKDKENKLDYNKATDDVIAALASEVVSLKEELDRRQDFSGTSSMRLTPQDIRRRDKEDKKLARLESRLLDAVELIDSQRSHIMNLERKLKDKSPGNEKGSTRAREESEPGKISLQIETAPVKKRTQAQLSPIQQILQQKQVQAQQKQGSPTKQQSQQTRQKARCNPIKWPSAFTKMGNAAKSPSPLPSQVTSPTKKTVATPVSSDRAEVERMRAAQRMESEARFQRLEKAMAEELRARVASIESTAREEDRRRVSDVYARLQRLDDRLREPRHSVYRASLETDHAAAVTAANDALSNLREILSASNGDATPAMKEEAWAMARQYACLQRAADEVARRLREANTAAEQTGGDEEALCKLRVELSESHQRADSILISGGDVEAYAAEVSNIVSIEAEMRRWRPIDVARVLAGGIPAPDGEHFLFLIPDKDDDETVATPVYDSALEELARVAHAAAGRGPRKSGVEKGMDGAFHSTTTPTRKESSRVTAEDREKEDGVGDKGGKLDEMSMKSEKSKNEEQKGAEDGYLSSSSTMTGNEKNKQYQAANIRKSGEKNASSLSSRKATTTNSITPTSTYSTGDTESLYTQLRNAVLNLLEYLAKRSPALGRATVDHESFVANQRSQLSAHQLMPLDAAFVRHVCEILPLDLPSEGEGEWSELLARVARGNGGDSLQSMLTAEDTARLLSGTNITLDSVPRVLRELLIADASGADTASATSLLDPELQRRVREAMSRAAENRHHIREETIADARRQREERILRRIFKRHAERLDVTSDNSSSSSYSYSRSSSSTASTDSEASMDVIMVDTRLRRRVLSASRYRCAVPLRERHAVLRRRHRPGQVIVTAEFGGDVAPEVSRRIAKPAKSSATIATLSRAESKDEEVHLNEELPPVGHRGLSRAQLRQHSPFDAAEMATRVMACFPPGSRTAPAVRVQPTFVIPLAAHSLPCEESNTPALAKAVLTAEHTSWVYGLPAEYLQPMLRAGVPRESDTVLFVPGQAESTMVAPAQGRRGEGATSFVGRMLARLQLFGSPSTLAAQRLNAQLQMSMAGSRMEVIGRNFSTKRS